jgi:hypothetical protein
MIPNQARKDLGMPDDMVPTNLQTDAERRDTSGRQQDFVIELRLASPRNTTRYRETDAERRDVYHHDVDNTESSMEYRKLTYDRC